MFGKDTKVAESSPTVVTDVSDEKDVWQKDAEIELEEEKSDKPLWYKILNVAWRVVALLALLYWFIICLDLLGTSIAVLGGHAAGRTFRDSEVLANPLGALCLGILVTVLVQSSSTSTSIIITMTAEGLITLRSAIPIIMGANIGTSVTNTIVSFIYMKDRQNYRRAFAGATVHDIFNIAVSAILLILEVISGYLYEVSTAMVRATGLSLDENEKGTGSKVELLKKITSPLVKELLSYDKKLVTKIAKEKDPEKLAALDKKSIVKHSLFGDGPGDYGTGAIWLILSLTLLCVTLYLIVLLLKNSLKGKVVYWMKRIINNPPEHPYLKWTHGWILILFGCGCTILVQSSSIFTSTLTPLVAVGVVQLEKCFALTLGSNVGTTVTGIIAALASSNVGVALALALSHTWFNVTGIVLFWPIPFMRNLIVNGAKHLGMLAMSYRWFPIVYGIFAFIAVPGIIVGLASAGLAVFLGVFLPLLVFTIFAIVMFYLGKAGKLDNQSWVPTWFKKLTRPEPEVAAQPGEKHVVEGDVAEGNEGKNLNENADIENQQGNDGDVDQAVEEVVAQQEQQV